MSQQSFEHTDEIGLLRVVDEAGPISTMAMVTEFKGVVKKGYVGSDGLLTEKGKQYLAEQDRQP